MNQNFKWRCLINKTGGSTFKHKIKIYHTVNRLQSFLSLDHSVTGSLGHSVTLSLKHKKNKLFFNRFSYRGCRKFSNRITRQQRSKRVQTIYLASSTNGLSQPAHSYKTGYCGDPKIVIDENRRRYLVSLVYLLNRTYQWRNWTYLLARDLNQSMSFPVFSFRAPAILILQLVSF